MAVFLFANTKKKKKKMKKEELYNQVADIVCQCTGVGKEELERSRKEECTDARSILVQVLSRYLTDVQISGMMRLTPRGVNYLRNTFLSRSAKWFVSSNYEEVRKQLGSNPLTAM